MTVLVGTTDILAVTVFPADSGKVMAVVGRWQCAQSACEIVVVITGIPMFCGNVTDGQLAIIAFFPRCFLKLKVIRAHHKLN